MKMLKVTVVMCPSSSPSGSSSSSPSPSGSSSSFPSCSSFSSSSSLSPPSPPRPVLRCGASLQHLPHPQRGAPLHGGSVHRGQRVLPVSPQHPPQRRDLLRVCRWAFPPRHFLFSLPPRTTVKPFRSNINGFCLSSLSSSSLTSDPSPPRPFPGAPFCQD